MLPQFANQHVLVDVRPVQISLKLFGKRRELLTVLDHRVDRIVLQLLGRLQLGGVFRQYADALLAIFIVIICPIRAAAYQPEDDNQEVDFQHLDDALFLQDKPKRTTDNANENNNRL